MGSNEDNMVESAYYWSIFLGGTLIADEHKL